MAMEEARRDLQHRLEEVLGKEHALTLMAALPHDDPVTRTELRTELELTRTEMKTELERVEARLAERIDLKAETSEHRMISALERGLGDLRKEMVAQTRVFVFSTLTAVIASSGLAVTATRLG